MDENVNPILRSALLSQDAILTVWQVGMLGAQKLGTPDAEILIWYEENEFILVTNSCKSMPVHLEEHLALERHLNGILTLSENMSVGETVVGSRSHNNSFLIVLINRSVSALPPG